ncbi:hypothetical protein HQ865_04210 [Mucilaginibacter mali]|uniref:Uncharacterized protein n=1 Tax=Mucilaginibacter mali TaxID=2740462 RepID=A0A7D4QQA7_9SPHI|nr:hypothetical protein [Mucilaginibacter mali]QKJ28989.1 hypothetical protein HQ865_04210 [Mucilaginibacter mali]
MKYTLPIGKTAVLCLMIATVQAQKLPNKQEVSLRAPADMKTDGKLTEWEGKLQAYNTATEIYYAISNDDERLFLTIQCKYRDIVDKILRGGITLSINHIIKKNDPEAVMVTYPVLRGADMSAVTNMFAKMNNEKSEAHDGPVPVGELNTLLQNKSKLINIKGIKPITDPAISVYNEEGIKAVSLFDTGLTYTYELAIPLKYLNLPATPFSYHLKINAPDETPLPPNGRFAPPVVITATAPTDFWGEYNLAKKQ